jgi:glutaredoxin
MKSSSRTLSLLLMSLCSIAATAATIVECEDAAGARTFQTLCPPETTQVQSKDYATGTPDAGPVTAKPAITIYLVPKCAACDAYMKFFSRYGIAPTVKNIDGNQELQDELTKISGALKAPTVIIGDKILSDYKEQELVKLFEGVGYKAVKGNNP